MSSTFEWIQFPEGRARFAGSFRCWDEQGRETFALELHGQQYYGQIDNIFIDNHNDYKIFIDAFGYTRGQDVGIPAVAARHVFSREQEAVARQLVIQLIRAGVRLDEPPFALDPPGSFTGEIVFGDEWILTTPDDAGEA